MQLRTIYRIDLTSLFEKDFAGSLLKLHEKLKDIQVYELSRFYGTGEGDKLKDINPRIKIYQEVFKKLKTHINHFSLHANKYKKEGRSFKMLITFDSTPQGHVSVMGNFHYIENDFLTNILEPFEIVEDPFKRFDF